MDEFFRHPVVIPIVAGVVLGLLGYTANAVRKVVKVPAQVEALDNRLTAHLHQEEKDNTAHADAVAEVHERIDDLYKLLIQG